jgi:hypothetical protein
MKEFDVSENFIFGPIPSILPELVSLETYRCARNLLSGTIPSVVGLMPRLREFSVSLFGLVCRHVFLLYFPSKAIIAIPCRFRTTS